MLRGAKAMQVKKGGESCWYYHMAGYSGNIDELVPFFE